MPRRRAITDAQLEALLALPTAEPDLIRHYTLSPADLAVIARRRRPHNRLGFAIQLCALRFPGRLLQPGEVVPRQVLVFVADQLDLPPDVLADYAARPQTRYDQLDALYSVYRFQTSEQHELAQWLLPVALTSTSGGPRRPAVEGTAKTRHCCARAECHRALGGDRPAEGRTSCRSTDRRQPYRSATRRLGGPARDPSRHCSQRPGLDPSGGGIGRASRSRSADRPTRSPTVSGDRPVDPRRNPYRSSARPDAGGNAALSATPEGAGAAAPPGNPRRHRTGIDYSPHRRGPLACSTD